MTDKPTCKTCGWASFESPTYRKGQSAPQAKGICKLWLTLHPSMWMDQSQTGETNNIVRTMEMGCAHHLDADHATPDDLERVRRSMPCAYAHSDYGFWDEALRITDDLYQPTNHARHWQPIQRQRIACEACVFERNSLCGLTLDNPAARAVLEPDDHRCDAGCSHGQLKQTELNHPNNQPPHRWWL